MTYCVTIIIITFVKINWPRYGIIGFNILNIIARFKDNPSQPITPLMQKRSSKQIKLQPSYNTKNVNNSYKNYTYTNKTKSNETKA